MASADIPDSILIIGSGVFGLSTAYALTQRPAFAQTKITLLDRVPFPAPDGSSIDSSRIVRADYADLAYAQLMREGHEQWRGELGANGRYTESGLAIIAAATDDPHMTYFVEQALHNLTDGLGLKPGRHRDIDGAQVTRIDGPDIARDIMGTTGGDIGPVGYVNWTAGWAHAESAMRWLQAKVAATGRVEFRTAEVARLLFAENADGTKRVDGAVVRDSAGGESTVTAALTVLAAGAWTPAFIDLRGRASATGQVMAYVTLTDEEQARLATNPVYISATSSLFIIPPVHNELKVARHGFGYANPVDIPHPERPVDSGETITVSLPRTRTTSSSTPSTTTSQPKTSMPEGEGLPAEGDAACRAFLQACIPELGVRAWSRTRICWYTDTPKGDFIVDRHPGYAGLVVATGGSGHAFKFLPVIGERVVDLVEGESVARGRDALGAELRARWAWPAERQEEDHVWCQDWRGGVKGMVLSEEYRK